MARKNTSSSKNKRTNGRSGRASRSRLPLIAGAFAVVLVAVAGVVMWARSSNEATTLASTAAATAAANAAPVGGIQGDAAALDLVGYAGKVVVVNFMAGWCTSCWAEIPDFEALYRERQDDGLVVLGISLQTPEEQTRAMIEQLGISYSVFQDELGTVALQRFGLRSMPTTLVFDRQGRQVQRFDGPILGHVLRSAVAKLL